VQKVEQNKQGTGDVESNWAKARLGWSTQLLISFGELDWEAENPGQPVPEYYNKANLTKISPYQYMDWGEVHRKCTPAGSATGSLIQTANVLY
jgi:hypothetical protein